MPYLYRLMNKQQEVIYVGQTADITKRMNEHFKGRSNLPSEVHYKELRYAEYHFSSSQLDIDSFEQHYIKKWKPKYNTSEIVGDPLTSEPHVLWKRYNKTVKYDLKTKYIIQLEDELEEMRRKLQERDGKILELTDLLNKRNEV